jgi:predicted transposase YdaD
VIYLPDKFSNANIQYRDSVFRDFFNNPVRLLNLCNSLLDSNFSSTNDIEINTLDSNFFSALKNDISCKIGNNFLVLIEHQSSVNQNMPFRCLSYVSELLNNLVQQKKFLYKQGLISFPAPKFFVFYDGDNKSEPVSKILKLSDAFNGDSSALELIVHSFNINLNFNSPLFKKCHYLNEYSTLIFYVKLGLSKKLSRRNAIINAIQRCIDENIMKDYLLNKREEVFSMLDLQWNLEDAKQAWHDEGFQQGIKTGVESVAINMLRKHKSFEEIADSTDLPIERIQQLSLSLHTNSK